ncbi:MAG TPA: FAD-dependent oxidoreductase [Gemmata sp.]|nr:FAD-dependent oxidoreductase [Gemmata sp.]
MRRVDFVVVGQGLAGTAVARRLAARGRSVLVIDREGPSSSRVAAGLVTPVTGKRLAKSWRWDELYPAAVAYYREFEREAGEMVFHQRPALRLFASRAERDEFGRRAAGVLAGLVRPAEDIPDAFAAPLGGFEMPHAARLDVPRYLDLARDQFRRAGAYLAADLDPAGDVRPVPDGVRLPRLDVEARGLVFCRGFAVDSDPWFGHVRFNAAKGEVLTLRVPGLAEGRVVHRGAWLAPAGGDAFRCGSTYDRERLDAEPTAAGRAEIESRLREFLRLPFEVTDHRAAVRPVIDAGLPVLARHPEHPQLAYFNGLGSKGSLLAPFFAGELAASLAGA